VVRLIGPGVAEFLARHVSKPSPPGRCVHAEIRDDEKVLDDAVVVTTAEFADFSLHGNPLIVRSMLNLAERCGFVVERDDDAVEAADELEREVLTHVPLARTREALAILLAQPEAWRNIRPCEVQAILHDKSLYWLLHPPRVAIIGAPNVGKSTLANQLFAQERSITPDVPGTTRDWVGEEANIDGLAVTLLDTPGIRANADAVEHEAIARSSSQIQNADLVIIVLDLSDELRLCERFPNAIVVYNKSDLHPAPPNQIATAATSGEGIDRLRNEIRRRFQCDDLNARRARWWTQRQRSVLQKE